MPIDELGEGRIFLKAAMAKRFRTFAQTKPSARASELRSAAMPISRVTLAGSKRTAPAPTDFTSVRKARNTTDNVRPRSNPNSCSATSLANATTTEKKSSSVARTCSPTLSRTQIRLSAHSTQTARYIAHAAFRSAAIQARIALSIQIAKLKATALSESAGTSPRFYLKYCA